MTHSYLALTDLDEPIKLIKGHQYLMSEKSIEELDIKNLPLKELTEDEALALYKEQ